VIRLRNFTYITACFENYGIRSISYMGSFYAVILIDKQRLLILIDKQRFLILIDKQRLLILIDKRHRSLVRVYVNLRSNVSRVIYPRTY